MLPDSPLSSSLVSREVINSLLGQAVSLDWTRFLPNSHVSRSFSSLAGPWKLILSSIAMEIHQYNTTLDSLAALCAHFTHRFYLIVHNARSCSSLGQLMLIPATFVEAGSLKLLVSHSMFGSPHRFADFSGEGSSISHILVYSHE